jgi:hypothetical protein
MRPAVSISFWRPVKNGWQDEQISTRISPLCVELVLKVWPQAQMTLILVSGVNTSLHVLGGILSKHSVYQKHEPP